MLKLTLLLTLRMTANALNLSHPPHPLTPCGSHNTCTTPAYNYLPHVHSLPTCQSYCESDPQCTHYSYNYNPHSQLYTHCFLYRQCTLAIPATPGWVTATKTCQGTAHQSQLMAALRTSYFRAAK